MNFDDITIDQLRSSGNLKWAGSPDSIGMFVAEMDLGLAEPIRRVLRQYADSPGIGYRSASAKRDLQEATAGWLAKNTAWAPRPEQVRAVPDVVSSARVVLDQLTTPGSPAILPTPAYMGFTSLIPAMGREMIEVPCVLEGGRYRLDLDGIRAGFERGAQALMLVNPANPTGRVYTREELRELSEVVAEFPDAIVFSDDIHAPLVLEGEHIPYASVSEVAASHTVTAVAASKGWSIPGLKCAQLVISNPDHVRRLEPYLGWADSITSTVGAAAAVAAYTEGEAWRAALLDYLRGNRDLFAAAVAGWPGVWAPHIEGTYIGWLDFTDALEAGALADRGGSVGGKQIAEWLAEHTGVVLTPGAACGKGYEAFARIILATPRPILEDALGRMTAALEG
ncbi:MalY/PatB family protein [Trueperella bialowiezensis]|uniref:cysteine-S-conjugate beta-lyase n=1 Tax=Trueperella bialowiezensis TaxID=312285 RepID=A0A448PGH2_9ACTO|nr:aminotransferase class I/II-fold pyridoxal phosphate-dependent enzyme [Trueperella bialowiezensis]VEI14012.1 Cystathionine beta-lyase PatB [Trueperella bialowiezensis]